MKTSAFYLAPAIAALLLTSAAMAEETYSSSNITIEQAASLMHYSGGNDRFRVEVAPNYSEELGVSLKGAAGGYLTDALALGLIVEYGEDKREYLANAGIQFNDALSLVGTVGMLEEHHEYVDGEGKETVQQMEYGASLKGAYEAGLISGFALNGYSVDAEADSDSVETGKLYGVQLLTDLDLTDTTHIEIGGGYEWLEWDETGGDDSSWTFSAEAAQQLGDMLSLTGHAKLGASEYVYGGGLAFDLSNGGLNTNSLAVNYSYIDGQNGIEDDQRVELSWSIGFGAGPTTSVAAADLTDKSGTIRAAADVAMVSPANNLLSDVMKRPAFLPQQVVARAKAKSSANPSCSDLGISFVGYGWSPTPVNVVYYDNEANQIDVFVDSGTIDLNPSSATLGSNSLELFLVRSPRFIYTTNASTTDLISGSTYPITVNGPNFTCTQSLTAVLLP